MAAISIRNLDDDVRDRLRIRAAQHGNSMEAEIRAILTRAVDEPAASDNLVHVLVERVRRLGGVELEIPPRSSSPARGASFD